MIAARGRLGHGEGVSACGVDGSQLGCAAVLPGAFNAGGPGSIGQFNCQSVANRCVRREIRDRQLGHREYKRAFEQIAADILVLDRVNRCGFDCSCDGAASRAG